jgi:hypothetical protein
LPLKDRFPEGPPFSWGKLHLAQLLRQGIHFTWETKGDHHYRIVTRRDGKLCARHFAIESCHLVNSNAKGSGLETYSRNGLTKVVEGVSVWRTIVTKAGSRDRQDQGSCVTRPGGVCLDKATKSPVELNGFALGSHDEVPGLIVKG